MWRGRTVLSVPNPYDDLSFAGHSHFFYMDFQEDRDLWDAAQRMPLPREEEVSYWGFSTPEASGPFQLTIWRNAKRESAFMALEHAPLLALFDLSYWTAYTDSHLDFDPIITHNLCFLQTLRQRVEKEILGAHPGCATLLFWAVRSFRRKNHFLADASALQKEGAYSHFPERHGKSRLIYYTPLRSHALSNRMGYTFDKSTPVCYKGSRNSPSRGQFGSADWTTRFTVVYPKSTRPRRVLGAC
jgi:hypothetical protein